jgi:hypothetical protein
MSADDTVPRADYERARRKIFRFRRCYNEIIVAFNKLNDEEPRDILQDAALASLDSKETP